MTVITVVMHDHQWKDVPMSRNLKICRCNFMRFREEDGTLREPTLLELEVYSHRVDEEARRLLVRQRVRSAQQKGLILG